MASLSSHALWRHLTRDAHRRARHNLDHALDRSAAQEMLTFTAVQISTPLTNLSTQENEDKATDNFKHIMMYMGDKDNLSGSMTGEVIVRVANRSNELCDEVYLQLIKQLSLNPSYKSKEQGWILMQVLCQQALPTNEVYTCLDSFLTHSMFPTACEAKQLPDSASAERERQEKHYEANCRESEKRQRVLAKGARDALANLKLWQARQAKLSQYHEVEVHTEEDTDMGVIRIFSLLGRNTLQDVHTLMRRDFGISRNGAKKYWFFKDPNEDPNHGSPLWHVLPNECTIAEVTEIKGRLVFGRLNISSSKEDDFPASYADARLTFVHARKQFLEYRLPLATDDWSPVTEALFMADKTAFNPAKLGRGDDYDKKAHALQAMMASDEEQHPIEWSMMMSYIRRYIPRTKSNEPISSQLIQKFQSDLESDATSLKAMKVAFELMRTLPDFDAYVYESVTFKHLDSSAIDKKNSVGCASSSIMGREPCKDSCFPQNGVSYTLLVSVAGLELRTDEAEYLKFSFSNKIKPASCYILTTWKPLAENILALGFKEKRTIMFVPNRQAVALSSLLMKLKGQG